MADLSPAREAAFNILSAVERGRAHSDDLLRGREANSLSPADRNLATALVLGVVRWQIWLDAQIRPMLKRPNAKLEPAVSIALRLGVFQLLFLDRVPARAAIDESVELAKRSGHRFASGMVNAVLRGMAHGNQLEKARDESGAALAQPAWMVERWVRFYGSAAAQAICQHNQKEPQLTLRVLKCGVESELELDGVKFEPGIFLSSARSVVSGDVRGRGAVRDGRAWIQDEGSQLVGELAAGAGSRPDGMAKNILDACAAPGGKTLILAERLPEARIMACETSEKRFAQLRDRTAGFKDRVECVRADATGLGFEADFDLALADVPCSGTGTLGRNPEIRHRLRLEDLARHAERQRAILRTTIRAVRPGGRVVYSTCSLEPEENEQVVAAVLAENVGARQISLAPIVGLLRQAEILTDTGAERLRECFTGEGALLLLPGVLPTDGFFVALIEKAQR